MRKCGKRFLAEFFAIRDGRSTSAYHHRYMIYLCIPLGYSDSKYLQNAKHASDCFFHGTLEYSLNQAELFLQAHGATRPLVPSQLIN